MDVGHQNAIFLAVVLAGVGAGLAGARARSDAARDEGVLAAIPRDAWLVVTVDVGALRGSPLAQPLLGSAAAAGAVGVTSLADTCGFDPVARLREVAVASPEGGEKGDFGVAFAGDLTKDELASCARKVIGARGGRAVESSRGSFAIVEDAGGSGADPSKPDARTRVAYRDGGPFLAGRGAWLDAMMDAAEGKAPRVIANDTHASLRKSLAAAGTSARAVVLTASLPRALREKLKAEMAAEAGSEGDRAWAGVLSVDRAGVALTTGLSGSTTEIAVELRCETTEACDEVKKLGERKRSALSRDFGVRLVGLGPLLDSLVVEAHDTALTASARAPTDDLARVVQKMLDLRAPPRPAAPPSAPAAAPAIPAETVRPRDAG